MASHITVIDDIVAGKIWLEDTCSYS